MDSSQWFVKILQPHQWAISEKSSISSEEISEKSSILMADELSLLAQVTCKLLQLVCLRFTNKL
jgi:hypothetical protein